MNTVFFSCNGFSLDVDQSKYKSDMWVDFLRHHNAQDKISSSPSSSSLTSSSHIHVMLGGGDQLYCDLVREICPPIKAWISKATTEERISAPFTPTDRLLTEQCYLSLYLSWFGQGWGQSLEEYQDQLQSSSSQKNESTQSKSSSYQRIFRTAFPKALASVPSINIFDDHDLIDGFGSYTDAIMGSPVFKGIGNTAFKYYMLFQHHSLPSDPYNQPQNQNQHQLLPLDSEPQWICDPANQPRGPYIDHISRSVYARLGKSVAFLGLDCRTERSPDQIVYSSSYERVFARLRREISLSSSTQSNNRIEHLLVMLGVPIFYPRLTAAEKILKNRLVSKAVRGGARFESKFGKKSSSSSNNNKTEEDDEKSSTSFSFAGLLNKFDGEIDILDDMDDHWCALAHVAERQAFISQLQQLSRETSVRITILGGDVHLAALGRMYTKSLKDSPIKDHRLMLNIVSSAMTNASPSATFAKFLVHQNIPHKRKFDSETREDMVKLFNVDVDGSPLGSNKVLLPRRNWCSIIENNGTGPTTTTTSNIIPTPPTSSSGPGKEKKSLVSEFKKLGFSKHFHKDNDNDNDDDDDDDDEGDSTALNYPSDRGSLSVIWHIEKDIQNSNSETRDYKVIVPILRV